jgi:GNAT superfamily N-acetyltransferase
VVRATAIRPATPADLPAVGRAMASAFEHDPVWTHLVRNRPGWDQRAAAWFTAEARVQLAGHGHLVVDDEVRGAALWSPPKRWKADLRETLALAWPSVRLFRRQLPWSMRLMADLEKAHPREPHWYLAFLGTHQDHQGHGIGGALIRAVTDRCDREGVGAYLESSKETNVPFYARHGFEVTGTVHLPRGGPPMYLMWRDPRG